MTSTPNPKSFPSYLRSVNLSFRDIALNAVAKLPDEKASMVKYGSLVSHLDLMLVENSENQATLRKFVSSIIADEPPEEITALNKFCLVHFGALAEHVAKMANLEPPSWSQDEGGIFWLPSATFIFHSAPAKGSNSRFLMATTPSAFKRRNMFCGANVFNLDWKSISQL